MTKMEALSAEVTKALRETEEYKRYHRILTELKENPELYRRVSELRDKNYARQTAGNEDMLDIMESLTNEYRDVINIGIVEDFLQAEAAFCRVVRHFTEGVIQGLEFN